MRLIAIFRDNQDYTRTITDWIEDFYRQTGREIETMDPDESPNFCEAYDILEFPTIIALGDDGSVRSSWSGPAMPLIDDVLFYAIQ